MQFMEWQPIETAPKDGTRIIGKAEGRMAVVSWHTCYDGYWSLDVCGLFCESSEWWPTHWLPAPADDAAYTAASATRAAQSEKLVEILTAGEWVD